MPKSRAKRTRLQKKLLKSLGNRRFIWRTADSISEETGLDKEKVVYFLEHSKKVIRSVMDNRKGEALYSTRKRYEKEIPFVWRMPRVPKYFYMLENSDVYWVIRSGKYYYLGRGEPHDRMEDHHCKTISEALGYEAMQYAGGMVAIETNIKLDELFEIMNMHNFEPFLLNAESVTLNGVEIDIDAFRQFVSWYAKCARLNRRASDVRNLNKGKWDQSIL